MDYWRVLFLALELWNAFAPVLSKTKQCPMLFMCPSFCMQIKNGCYVCDCGSLSGILQAASNQLNRLSTQQLMQTGSQLGSFVPGSKDGTGSGGQFASNGGENRIDSNQFTSQRHHAPSSSAQRYGQVYNGEIQTALQPWYNQYNLSHSREHAPRLPCHQNRAKYTPIYLDHPQPQQKQQMFMPGMICGHFSSNCPSACWQTDVFSGCITCNCGSKGSSSSGSMSVATTPITSTSMRPSSSLPTDTVVSQNNQATHAHPTLPFKIPTRPPTLKNVATSSMIKIRPTMKAPTTLNMLSQTHAKEQSIQPTSVYFATRETDKVTSQIGSLAKTPPHMLPLTTVLPTRLNNTSDRQSTPLFRTSHMTTSPVLNVMLPTQKPPSVDGSIQRKQYGDIRNSGHLHNIFHGKISKYGPKYSAKPSNLSENKYDFTMTTKGYVITTLPANIITESTTAITDYTPYVRLESRLNQSGQIFQNKNPSTNEVIMQNFRVPSERVTGLPGFLETPSNNQTKTFSGTLPIAFPKNLSTNEVIMQSYGVPSERVTGLPGFLETPSNNQTNTFSGSLPIAFPPGYNIVSSDRRNQTTTGSMAGAFRSFQMDDIVHTSAVDDKTDISNFHEDNRADNNAPAVGFYSDFQVIDGTDIENTS